MIYHFAVESGTGELFEGQVEVYNLNAELLETIDHQMEVWEIECNDKEEYDTMNRALEAWEMGGNKQEQLDIPWNARV